MRADGRDGSALEQSDPIGERQCRRPVDDKKRGDAFEHACQRFLDDRFRVHIHRRQRVVEHQHLRPAKHCSRQRESLPLAAGERVALLADASLETPREVPHESRPRHI